LAYDPSGIINEEGLHIVAFNDELEANITDYTVALWKGITGAIPFAGPLIAEFISVKVPNQQLDRLAKWIKVYESKFSDAEQKRLQDNKYFEDLLHDAILQSTRSLSDERNVYIATFLENNKDVQEGDFSVKKKLLHTLETLTDTDIDILNSINSNGYGITNSRYSVSPVTTGAYKEMTHDEQYEYDLARASWDAHTNALVQNKLLYAKHVMWYDDGSGDSRHHIDDQTGLPKIECYEMTNLGKMLLKSIGVYKYTEIEKRYRQKN